jgi:hypothetical protein
VKALLKLNADFDPIAIGAETRDSCGKSELRETPQESRAEEAPELPAESERLERKSTGRINKANVKNSPGSQMGQGFFLYVPKSIILYTRLSSILLNEIDG